MSTETELQTIPNESTFSLQSFEHAQRVAKMLASSDLIPTAYRNRIDNVMIAMEMANRMSLSPIAVMQNLYVVNGMPGWSGKFVIATINGSKRFATELDFEISGEGDDYGYTAYAIDKNGITRRGTKVDWKMVKAEGWLNKTGSKWKTMPEQMFKYRSASFFGNAYCPDLLMGIQTYEEIIDVSGEPEITVEELQKLVDNKIDLLNKSEFDSAKRIIANKEKNSYKKLLTMLNSKTV